MHHSCGGVCLTLIFYRSPLGLDLWHCHLCHHHLAGIKKLLAGDLVMGFELDSQTNPDPVCEPCKAGKMHMQIPSQSLPPEPQTPAPFHLTCLRHHKSLSIPISMALSKCPHIEGITIGSLSLMTSLLLQGSLPPEVV